MIGNLLVSCQGLARDAAVEKEWRQAWGVLMATVVTAPRSRTVKVLAFFVGLLVVIMLDPF
jgi:hypothetical protein